MKHLLKCPDCQTYTLRPSCPNCRAKTLSPKPPKFSLQDKYGDYRRKQKKIELNRKGLY